jgi:hypothetical protein
MTQEKLFSFSLNYGKVKESCKNKALIIINPQRAKRCAVQILQPNPL